MAKDDRVSVMVPRSLWGQLRPAGGDPPVVGEGRRQGAHARPQAGGYSTGGCYGDEARLPSIEARLLEAPYPLCRVLYRFQRH